MNNDPYTPRQAVDRIRTGHRLGTGRTVVVWALFIPTLIAAVLIAPAAANADDPPADASTEVCTTDVDEYLHQKFVRERFRPIGSTDADWGPWSEWHPFTSPQHPSGVVTDWSTDDRLVTDSGPHGQPTGQHDGVRQRREGEFEYRRIDTRTTEQETECPPSTTAPETTTPPTTEPPAPTTVHTPTTPETTTPATTVPPTYLPPIVTVPETVPSSTPGTVSPSPIEPTILRSARCGEPDRIHNPTQPDGIVLGVVINGAQFPLADDATYPLNPGVQASVYSTTDRSWQRTYTGGPVATCATGEPTTPPADVRLPETGTGTTVLALIAGWLVFGGLVAVRLARRTT